MPCRACAKCLTQLTAPDLKSPVLFALHTDSDQEEFFPWAFDDAIESAMELGLPVLCARCNSATGQSRIPPTRATST